MLCSNRIQSYYTGQHKVHTGNFSHYVQDNDPVPLSKEDVSHISDEMTERETEVEEDNSLPTRDKDGVNETLELVPGESESATVTSHSKKKKKNKKKTTKMKLGKWILRLVTIITQ